MSTSARPDGYPGAGLGLPPSGRGSVAGVGVKLLALILDGIVAYLVGLAVSVLFGVPSTVSCPSGELDRSRSCRTFAHATFDRNLVITTTFLVMVAALLALSGRTVGMLLMRLQLVRLDGRRIGWAAIPRTLLLAFIIPAVVMDRDRRGLHDRAANTVVVNVR